MVVSFYAPELEPTMPRKAAADDNAAPKARRTVADSAGQSITAGASAPASLTEYQRMRDFGTTPEPSGDEVVPGAVPIFVVQLHLATARHYDLRLEMGGVLKSWAVPKGPSYSPKDKRLAMMTEDHPLAYATFEGVIPEGHYGAGPMLVWDTGTVAYVPDDKTGEPDPLVNLERGKLIFRLTGTKLNGEWTLVKTRGFGGRENSWLLIKHRDATAREDYDVVASEPTSVQSGRTIEEVRAAGQGNGSSTG